MQILEVTVPCTMSKVANYHALPYVTALIRHENCTRFDASLRY